MTTAHTDTHWIFIAADGTRNCVGKYIEFFRETDGGIDFEGVATEQEAIDLLIENGYSESDFQ